MEWLLDEKDGLRFTVSDAFAGRMLEPVLENVLDKARGEWDDYDEAYHCTGLVEAVRRGGGMRMDFHCIVRDGAHVGLGLVSYGRLDRGLFFPDSFEVPEALDRILVFNYFHISRGGRGNGERWLREVILPHYAGRGFRALYVKSSHPRVFPLYERLGEPVGEYAGRSDNGLRERRGRIFRVPLAEG